MNAVIERKDPTTDREVGHRVVCPPGPKDSRKVGELAYAGRWLRASRWGCGPRQAGARSAGVKVFCEGFAAGTTGLLPLTALTAPVSLGPSRSLRNS